MKEHPDWLLLILTLPADRPAARVRIWRALKSLGCGVLRDGVYVLPDVQEHASALGELARDIGSAGGTASVVRVGAGEPVQDASFRALFDRAQDYAVFGKSLAQARKGAARRPVPEVNRTLRRLRREYEALRAMDFFPGEASARAEAGWTDFIAFVDGIVSPGEPHAAKGAIRPLALKDYQGRTWATRKHLWVDRVASAWLIRHFIDRKARFLWLAKPSACPKDALGFDFDGAAFTHVGDKVTFEVLVASFGLDKDPGLARLGALVRSLDTGGAPVAEAAGFEAHLAGARRRHAGDDALLTEMTGALDSLHDFYSTPEPRRRT